MNWKWLNGILLVLIICSAIGVIYAKHVNRQHYAKLREYQKQRDVLNVDWGKLQLEQSTWATQSRVDTFARKKLSMRNIDYSQALVIKP